MYISERPLISTNAPENKVIKFFSFYLPLFVSFFYFLEDVEVLKITFCDHSGSRAKRYLTFAQL